MNIDNKPAPTTLHNNHNNLHHHHNNLIISTSAGQQQQQQQQQQLYSSGGSSASSGSSSPLSPPPPDVAFSSGGGGKPKRLKLDPKLSLDEGCAKIEPTIEEENSGIGLTTPPPNSRNPNKRKSIDNSTNLLIPVNKSLATNSFWLGLSRDRDYEDVDQNNNSTMSQCLRIESAADNVLSCLKFSQVNQLFLIYETTFMSTIIISFI